VRDLHVSSGGRRRAAYRSPRAALLAASLLAAAALAAEPDFFVYHGDPIPADVETMYARGLTYLAQAQAADGSWPVQNGTDPGVVGLAVLAVLAHGEDPNVGPYSQVIRRGINRILQSANAESGYIGSTMYNHGFATLALAEAYGVVDDPRIGPALQKGVQLILAAQSRNPQGAWRYSPDSRDADTTVSGAQMVALLAARNAGLTVPDEAIKQGLAFYVSCQSGDGGIGYTGPGSGNAPRTAIAILVMALARQKETAPFKAAFRFLKETGFQPDGRLHYYLYYAAPATFHADMTAWQEWNAGCSKRLLASQSQDGSWTGENGPLFSTAASLMALAVNYRFLPIYER
jgi:hypothetical protein